MTFFYLHPMHSITTIFEMDDVLWVVIYFDIAYMLPKYHVTTVIQGFIGEIALKLSMP